MHYHVQHSSDNASLISSNNILTLPTLNKILIRRCHQSSLEWLIKVRYSTGSQRTVAVGYFSTRQIFFPSLKQLHHSCEDSGSEYYLTTTNQRSNVRDKMASKTVHSTRPNKCPPADLPISADTTKLLFVGNTVKNIPRYVDTSHPPGPTCTARNVPSVPFTDGTYVSTVTDNSLLQHVIFTSNDQ